MKFSSFADLSQAAAEEEAIAALGKAREAYDEAASRLADLRWIVQVAEDTFLRAKEQYACARTHFAEVCQRSTEGL